MAQRKRIQLTSVRTGLRSLASLPGLRIHRCLRLQYSLKILLLSCVSVAVV